MHQGLADIVLANAPLWWCVMEDFDIGVFVRVIRIPAPRGRVHVELVRHVDVREGRVRSSNVDETDRFCVRWRTLRHVVWTFVGPMPVVLSKAEQSYL